MLPRLAIQAATDTQLLAMPVKSTAEIVPIPIVVPAPSLDSLLSPADKLALCIDTLCSLPLQRRPSSKPLTSLFLATRINSQMRAMFVSKWWQSAKRTGSVTYAKCLVPPAEVPSNQA